MNAAVLKAPRYRNIYPTTQTQKAFIAGLESADRLFDEHRGVNLIEIGRDSLSVLSTEFAGTSTMSTTAIIPHPTERVGIIHQLRLYTGAALIGAVLCGILFSWSSHKELIQCFGAAASMAIYAVLSRRHRHHGSG